jgi:hypothetical protein
MLIANLISRQARLRPTKDGLTEGTPSSESTRGSHLGATWELSEVSRNALLGDFHLDEVLDSFLDVLRFSDGPLRPATHPSGLASGLFSSDDD